MHNSSQLNAFQSTLLAAGFIQLYTQRDVTQTSHISRISQTDHTRCHTSISDMYDFTTYHTRCHTSISDMYDFTNISHTQNFTNRIVPRLRYHTRLHTMLPPCHSQLVLCTVIHSPCVPHYTIGSWFYAIVFFNHVHNPMDHDTNIMRSKLLLCSWFYAIVYPPLLALHPHACHMST